MMRRFSKAASVVLMQVTLRAKVNGASKTLWRKVTILITHIETGLAD
jgi:hypothetical protein